MQALQSIGSFGDNTSSAACWDLANRWLHDCKTKHERCCSQGPPRTYAPTRLIEIDRTGAEHQLHLSIEHSSKVEYLTLSHRWGTRPALTLTKAMISLWAGNIPYEDLSQTYRDAVIATNRLGFKYLWIDALCIVQDSKEDWYQEASAMADVYTNSICNLSALHARDDSDGMFSTRKPEENFPIVAALTSAKRPQRILHVEPHEYWDEQISRKELNRRGWVVQERLLAPRILHFGKTQLLWECRELHASESFPSGVQHGESWPNLTAHLQSWGAGKRDDDKIIRHSIAWYEVINLYSASNLSVCSDKLVAISGVAKVFGNAFNDDYCAGLWKSSIIHSLAWKILSSDGVRPSSYRAPSWSWASMDGQVDFEVYSHKRQALAFAESVEVTTVTDDAFGAVRDGVLRIRGQVFHGIHGTDEEFRHLASEIAHVDCLPNGSVHNDIYPDSKSEAASDSLCCMPIIVHSFSGFVDFISLILKPSDRQGMYERWGLLRTSTYRKDFLASEGHSSPEPQRFLEFNSDENPDQVVTIV